MNKLVFSLALIFSTSTLAASRLETNKYSCTIEKFDSNSQPVTQTVEIPHDWEIYLFPDGVVGNNPAEVEAWMNKHKDPNKKYDDGSEEAYKNTMELLHGTFLFSIHTEYQPDLLNAIGIHIIDKKLSLENGPLSLAAAGGAPTTELGASYLQWDASGGADFAMVEITCKVIGASTSN